MSIFFFFFNDTATTEIYTLSLHDALPIYHFHSFVRRSLFKHPTGNQLPVTHVSLFHLDRKSTRLNSSHANISYAVFCLKKKNKPQTQTNSSLQATNRIATSTTINQSVLSQ